MFTDQYQRFLVPIQFKIIHDINQMGLLTFDNCFDAVILEAGERW